MIRLAVVAFLLLASAQAPTVPATVGVLAGTVTERDGVVPGAMISVVGAAPARTALTNAFGRYRIEGVAAGPHRVEVRTSGFVTRRAEVTIIAGAVTAFDPVVEARTTRSNEPPVGPDPTDSRLAAAVYEAILRRLYRGQIPLQTTIATTSLIQPFLDDDLDWPAELGEVPVELRRRSRAADALRTVRLRPESLPPGARLVESPRLADSPSYTRFSRVFGTTDGLNALVVFEHVCGNLCAEGTVAWLTRETLAATWTVRRAFTFWVS